MALVSSLKPEISRSSGSVLWNGDDPRLLARITAALQEARIAYVVTSDGLNPSPSHHPSIARAEILVEPDYIRAARKVRDDVLSGAEEGDGGHEAPDGEVIGEADGPVCPLCNRVYVWEPALCPDCDIPLVRSRALIPPDFAYVFWSGKDKRVLRETVGFLRAQKTSFAGDTVLSAAWDFLFGDSTFEVRVRTSDRERIRSLLEESYGVSQETFPDEAGHSPASDFWAIVPSAPGDSTEYDPELPAEIVFAGDSETASMLGACFRENHISYHTESITSRESRLAVQAEDAIRARDIVRQVIDAVPPE